MKNKKIVLEIDNLVLSFEDKTSGKRKKVIRGTGFKLYEGDILGIVGESGSGKTVITSTCLGLAGSTARNESGKIVVDGTDVTKFKQKHWTKSKLLGKTISTVFQNPKNFKTTNWNCKTYKKSNKRSSENRSRRNVKRALL